MLKLRNLNIASCHWLTFSLMMYAPTGLAITSAQGKDIQVQANYMKFDMETGNSTYQGNVKISQGNIKINGDKVVIQRRQNKIQQINIDGQPARYSQNGDNKNTIHASSQHMKYIANKNRLIMTVDAHLQQPNHTINSQRIVYDTKNKIVIAGSNKKNQQGGRVNITLTPKKDKTTATSNTEKP